MIKLKLEIIGKNIFSEYEDKNIKLKEVALMIYYLNKKMKELLELDFKPVLKVDESEN